MRLDDLEMDEVLRNLYVPADVITAAERERPFGIDRTVERSVLPKLSLWWRLRVRLGRWLFSLAFWVSGDDESEDEEW